MIHIHCESKGSDQRSMRNVPASYHVSQDNSSGTYSEYGKVDCPPPPPPLSTPMKKSSTVVLLPLVQNSKCTTG